MLGILCAMPIEAAPVDKAMTKKDYKVCCGKKFVCGELFGQSTVLCISGVGKVNSSFGTTLLVREFGADVILNLGVVGSIDADLKLFDLVVGECAMQYDFDTSGSGILVRGQVDGFADKFIPLTQKYLQGFKEKGFRTGKLATTDAFKFVQENLDFLRQNGMAVEDMEIGAIAHVCAFLGVDVVSVKSVSNSVAQDGCQEYANQAQKAIDAYTNRLQDIVGVIYGKN